MSTLAPDTVEQVKTTVDASMGFLGVTIILGWVNLAVGFCVILWYMVRFYEYLTKRCNESKERYFYIRELLEIYPSSKEEFNLTTIEQLRVLHDKIREQKNDGKEE